ncbi:hypothetical protein BTM25_17730 [Actinomadura rubteroloni]|uniref:Uncharacterized protein n=1 Tax=Actinomadura rubteroloni TaxID=1926885 RepID=A0A2P4UQP2_9ACTN|nr:hypothetical protein [Actinomadura rubteroloni]POM27359.1 hypothetical protein BTM25_17730 [Actinomadura rubteroloni]
MSSGIAADGRLVLGMPRALGERSIAWAPGKSLGVEPVRTGGGAVESSGSGRKWSGDPIYILVFRQI